MDADQSIKAQGAKTFADSCIRVMHFSKLALGLSSFLKSYIKIKELGLGAERSMLWSRKFIN